MGGLGEAEELSAGSVPELMTGGGACESGEILCDTVIPGSLISCCGRDSGAEITFADVAELIKGGRSSESDKEP